MLLMYGSAGPVITVILLNVMLWLSNDGNVNMVGYYGDIVKVCCHDKVMIAL